jgi:hypothetical protein
MRSAGVLFVLAVLIVGGAVSRGIRVGSSDSLVAEPEPPPCRDLGGHPCLRQASYSRECLYLSFSGVSPKSITSPDGRSLPPCPLFSPH